MEAHFFTRHPKYRDALQFVIFVALVFLGTVIINSFIFRSFNVVGPSMEPTLHTGERLIVNRVPVTIAQLQNKRFVPKRGDIIVFKNPHYVEGIKQKYIVKRVIAFPGERVVLKNGVLKVFNKDSPDGFEPDATKDGKGPVGPSSGNVDTVVEDEAIFVAGDHREGEYSSDSRNGLGLIPYYDIIGPVTMRLWPINKFTFF